MGSDRVPLEPAEVLSAETVAINRETARRLYMNVGVARGLLEVCDSHELLRRRVVEVEAERRITAGRGLSMRPEAHPPGCYGDGLLHPLDETETPCLQAPCECGHRGSEHVAAACMFCECDEFERGIAHCDHWYDGEACHWCSAAALEPCPDCVQEGVA